MKGAHHLDNSMKAKWKQVKFGIQGGGTKRKSPKIVWIPEGAMEKKYPENLPLVLCMGGAVD